MKPNIRRSTWKKILVGMIIAFLCLQQSPVRPAAGLPAPLPAPAANAAPSWLEIVIEAPALTPAYGSGTCDSGWYRYQNNRGQQAYLAMNVPLPADRIHSGLWRPNLSETGSWKVEAYIPAHASATWNCPDLGLNKTISRDTSNAKYTIHYAGGESIVYLDQYPLEDQWAHLGYYEFSAGTNGYITLSDVTGEISGTRTVSFSAMRFTYIPHRVHLPVMRDIYPSVTLNDAWTSLPGSLREQSFYPGEAIQLSSRGGNSTGAPAPANYTWTISGDCPPSFPSSHSETHTLEIGDWTQAYTTTVPTCTGYYTYTLQVDYNSRSFVKEIPFVVNDPGAGTVMSLDASFDRCENPTPSQLQTWWEHSPYRVVNLYIGGIHRGCTNTGLTASWLRSASQIGWTFIPTWVGLQAPCQSYFSHKISTTPSVAYEQGRAEANSAAYAASLLELPRDTVIYYDLEAYAGSSVTTACRNAVISFMNGWVERLHERGRNAGVYGSPRGSYMADWWGITHTPDYIWLAVWYEPYFYDPSATVWVPNHLSNSLWANHQRIRQYTNSHTEEWGGLRLTIDSNIDDGAVATLPRQLSAGGLPEGGQETQAAAGGVQDSQLIDGKSGWALAGGRLQWTSTAGREWAEITPAGAAIEAASFLDGRQGWALGSALGSQERALFHTEDAGRSWQPMSLPALGEPGTFRVASLQFIDALTGWIAVQHVSSSNFSLGSLWKTVDGGRSWEQLSLPLGEAVRFLDAQRGWTAGGAGGNELYATRNGGRTWQAVALARPGQPGQTYVSLPVFENAQVGMLPVAHSGPEAPRLEIYTTADGGDTWLLAQEIPLAAQDAPGSPPLAAPAGSGRWIVDLPRAAQIYQLTGEQSLAPQASVSLPEGAVSLNLATSGAGWARTVNGTCYGSKPANSESASNGSEPFRCEMRSELWLTTDGGISWAEITP